MRLPGIPEEVERVESFDELRAGMIIWVLACSRCGSNHRSILIRLVDAVMDSGPARGWSKDPILPRCQRHTGKIRTVLTPNSPAFVDRRVYAVVDVTMDAERDTVARVRKLSAVG